MRKLFALVAAAALLAPSLAPAQSLQINRSQQGNVGPLVTATDPSGNQGKVVLQGIVSYDSSGAEKGTSANPLVTQQATGAATTVVGVAANGAAAAGNPVLVAGSDGTNARTVKTSATGAIYISGQDSNATTATTNPVGVAGLSLSDGKVRYIATDTLGYQLMGRVTPGTSITSASGNVANASAVATLAGISGKTTWITGFQCSAAGATAASVVNLTVGGVVSGTMTYTFVFPAGATTAASPLVVNFASPVPASATNTAITVTLPAGGAGNTNASCAAQGFQL